VARTYKQKLEDTYLQGYNDGRVGRPSRVEITTPTVGEESKPDANCPRCGTTAGGVHVQNCPARPDR